MSQAVLAVWEQKTASTQLQTWPPVPAGLAYWLSQFAAGRTAEDLIVGFAGSAEYYSEHSAKP